jgi:hypothetical protein
MTSTVAKATPVLAVERIEDVLPFWEALGFKRTVEVPDGDWLGFVILHDGTTELMYQTYASIGHDVPAVLEAARASRAILFVEVPDLDAVERTLAGHPVYLPRRTTFYGSTEIGYRDPAGHYVTFAQFKR